MRSSLTVHELEVFLEIADARSFRVAAERSLISQPAVSRTLQSAEWKLGIKLFDRNTSKVELTGAGKELLPIAQRIVSEFRHSLSDLSEFIAGRSGRVNVAALPSVAASVLPAALSGFQRTHPRVHATVQPWPTEAVQSMVLDGSADFGLSSRPDDRSNLLFEPLLRDEFVLVCHREEALAARSASTWKAFARHPFIASAPSTSIRQITDQVMSDLGLDVAPRYQSSHLGVLGAMVSAGLGMTAIPRLGLRLMDMAQLKVVLLKSPSVHRDIGLVTRKGRSLSAATLAMMDAARNAAARG